MHTRGTSCQRHVCAVVHDDRGRERDQCASDGKKVTGIHVLEAELDHRRSAAHRCGSATYEPVDAIAEIIRDGDQS